MSRLRSLINRELPFLMSMPAFLWEFYFLIVPIGVIALYSLAPLGGGGITFTHYAQLFTSSYFGIICNSCLLAAVTAGLCLLIAYPVAYYLAVRAKRFKNALLVFLILPSWTSFIIQIYSWFYLLQKGGVISSVLYRLGITGDYVSMLNSFGATILGMVYCFLPFMVLPIFTVLDRMDKRLLEASADLGANWWQTMTRIVLPLSASGVRIGLLLVTIPAFGEFAIPDLMGGFKGVYIGRAVMEKFLIYRAWHSGAALVLVSIVIPIVLIGLLSLMRWWWRLSARGDA